MLLALVAEKAPEPEILDLVTLWLNAGIITARGQWSDPTEGIAQGSVVSPLLANIYLHPLDAFAVDNKYHYIRYSDDFIVFTSDQKAAESALTQLTDIIVKGLRLRLNDNPDPFRDIATGFTFLGIYFRNDIRKISTAKEEKIIRKLNWLTDRSFSKDPLSFLSKLNESIQGTRRYYQIIQPMDQFRVFDQHLIYRLKIPLTAFRQAGVWTTAAELTAYLTGLSFYFERSVEDHTALIDGLVTDVWNQPDPKPDTRQVKKRLTPPKEIKAEPLVESQKADSSETPSEIPNTEHSETPPENSVSASRQRRHTAQKSKFLRLVSDQAEISVGTPGIFIGKTGGRIVLRQDRKNILEVPFSKIRYLSITSTGVSMSSDVVMQCARSRIPISFFDFKGSPCAVLQSPIHAMGELSMLQLAFHGTDQALAFIKQSLSGKSKNQMNVLKFYVRSRRELKKEFTIKANEHIEKMEILLKELHAVELESEFSITRDRLFSYEGRISHYYWSCLKDITPVHLGFESRQRHQARDIVNSMLNYGYGILYYRVWQAVMKTGLNPCISFLHAFQQSKPTLVYDLIEEFRQPFVDRPVFSLLTRYKKDDEFRIEKDTGLLEKTTKERVAKAVIGRLTGLVSYRGKNIKGDDIIEKQIKSVVSVVKGGKKYKPFIFRY
jgi:CRISPR-associated endonuclease Cas1